MVMTDQRTENAEKKKDNLTFTFKPGEREKWDSFMAGENISKYADVIREGFSVLNRYPGLRNFTERTTTEQLEYIRDEILKLGQQDQQRITTLDGVQQELKDLKKMINLVANKVGVKKKEIQEVMQTDDSGKAVFE